MGTGRFRVRDLVDSLQGLQSLVEMPVTALDDGLLFRLARVIRQIKPEVEVYERRRAALMRELGTVMARDGKSEVLDPAHQDAYEERLATLLERELPLNVERIPWSEVKDIPGLRVGHVVMCQALFEHSYDQAAREAVAERLEAGLQKLDELAGLPELEV